MAITTKDYKRIIDIIETAFSIRDRGGMLFAVVELIDRLIGISCAVYMRLDPKTQNFLPDDYFTYHCSPSQHNLFALYYALLNTLSIQGSSEERTKRPLCITNFLTSRQIKETECEPDVQSLGILFHEIVCNCYSQGVFTGVIGFYRRKNKSAFTEDEREAVNVITPFISNALQTIDLLASKAPSSETGAIIVNADGCIRYLNDEAERVLDGSPVESIPCPGKGMGSLYLRRGGGFYRIRTAGIGKGEKLILMEPFPLRLDLEESLCAFGLTERQDEIAMLVIRGRTNQEIAERLFIEVQTVKDHLREVFDKASVRSRSELTARVLGIDNEEK